MIITPGATSVSIDVRIVDDSGLAVTGLLAATLPAVYFSLAGNTAAAQITPLSDLTLITTAHNGTTGGGVKERSGSAGVYRLDIPNAAVASAGDVTIYGEATGKHLLCEPLTVVALPALDSSRRVTVATLANDSITAAALAADAVTEINAANLLIVQSGTARVAGIPPGTVDELQLAAAGASGTDNAYKGSIVALTGGTGKGQSRVIILYTASTQVAVMDRDWVVPPDGTTTYAILGMPLPFMTDNLTTFIEARTGFGGAGPITLLHVGDDTIPGNVTVANGIVDANFAGINGSASSDNHEMYGLAKMGVDYDANNAMILTAGERTNVALAVWNTLRSVTFGVGSIGEKIKLWFLQLGTDNRVLVSANTHTSGETVAGVTGGTGGGSLYGEDGDILYTETVKAPNGTTPLPGIEVFFSSDNVGVNRTPATKITDALGQVQFRFNAGTVYLWRRDPRQDIPGSSYYTFVNPVAKVVS